MNRQLTSFNDGLILGGGELDVRRRVGEAEDVCERMGEEEGEPSRVGEMELVASEVKDLFDRSGVYGFTYNSKIHVLISIFWKRGPTKVPFSE